MSKGRGLSLARIYNATECVTVKLYTAHNYLGLNVLEGTFGPIKTNFWMNYLQIII